MYLDRNLGRRLSLSEIPLLFDLKSVLRQHFSSAKG